MKLLILIPLIIFTTSCSLFLPRPQVISHIPPALTQPRLVHGCSEIKTQLKLATCYLKTSEALYLANQDKESLVIFEKKVG